MNVDPTIYIIKAKIYYFHGSSSLCSLCVEGGELNGSRVETGPASNGQSFDNDYSVYLKLALYTIRTSDHRKPSVAQNVLLGVSESV